MTQQKIHHLLVIKDKQGKRTVALEAATCSIGRDPTNSVVLYSNSVSRQHALLLRVPIPKAATDLFRIIDGNLQGKRSTNGLTVNGQRCFSHDLKHGDVIGFGSDVKATYYTTTKLSDAEFLTDCEAEELPGFLSSLSDPFPTLVMSDGELGNSSESETALIRLASFPELTSNPIIEIDLTGTITYLNPAAAAQFPSIQEERLQHPILAGLFSTELLTKIAIAQDKREKFAIREVKVGNQVYEQSIHYITESDLIRSYIFDITKRNQVEAALHRAHDELEIRIAQRTAELSKANEQLLREISVAKRLEEERQKAQEALRESQQMLQLVMDNIPQLIFWKDKHSVYLGCNRNFAQAAGVGSPENIVGKTDYDLPWKKEEADLFCECDRRVMEADTPEYHIIEPQLRADGEQTWVDTNKVPLHDLEGNVVGILGTYEDITERKRVEEALRQAEAKYRNIFENAIEGIFQSTPDGRYLSANPALARIYGYESPEELLRSLTDVAQQLYVEPHRRHDFVHLMQEYGSVSGFESQVYRRDGGVIWISENARSVRDRNNNLLYYEGTIEDITLAKRLAAERQQAEEQLRHNAFHDALTGLPNRALFMDRLEQAVKQAKRHKNHLFALLFLDLDRFKIVNDSLGHLMGDELLIAIARRLERCLRAGDTIARLGGDEFVILLNAIQDVDYPTTIAKRIEQELAPPFNLNGHEVFTSASIGIVLSSEVQGWADDLLRTADIAMYHAKSLGGACYQVFDTARHDQAVTRLQWETDLRRAIEHEEFRVYYQPIVSLATGSIVGFEALVRWQRPNGLLSPAEFVPIAEEIGLIIPIGRWILQEACCQMRAWQEIFPASLPLIISVNLSVKQCTQPEFVDQISQILLETNLNPRSLSLEITENVLLENAQPVAVVLSQLKALGISLYLDDFGTGYSSLNYLHRFPFHRLKIDRSFINQMGCGNQSLEIVRIIIMLAHALGMDVIAEGIETLDQLAQLSALSCKYGQGNFFSQPLDAATAGALIAEKLDGRDNHVPCTISDTAKTKDD